MVAVGSDLAPVAGKTRAVLSLVVGGWVHAVQGTRGDAVHASAAVCDEVLAFEHRASRVLSQDGDYPALVCPGVGPLQVRGFPRIHGHSPLRGPACTCEARQRVRRFVTSNVVGGEVGKASADEFDGGLALSGHALRVQPVHTGVCGHIFCGQ